MKGSGMNRMRGAAGRVAALALAAALAAPAGATEVLEAADHAELEAAVSATAVSRIALVGDRIARVVRGADGFTVEHDPARGDLYLRPAEGLRESRGAEDGPAAPEAQPEAAPAVLFLGTERGFTYRLVLRPVAGGPAQILIRNPEVATHGTAGAGDARIAALVRLVRSVARREPLPGYGVEAGAGRAVAGLDVIETWRGPRFSALVLRAGAEGPADASALGARLGPGMAAAWVSPASGIAVAVRENAREGALR